MMKTVDGYNFNINNFDLNTKCAEIFYCTSQFSIVCVSCRLICDDYGKFAQHYRGEHVNDSFTLSNKSNNYYQTLQNERILRDTEPTKMEHTELLQQKDQGMLSYLADENEEDEDFRKCGGSVGCINIEETSEYSVPHLGCGSEEEENPSDNAKTADNMEDIQSPEFDWSQTYAPQLLKNYHKRPYKPRNQLNTCSYCGRIFRRRYQLDTHLNIHTGLKPYQCDICGLQFRAINTLLRHLNIHGKRETFNCKYCDKVFAHRAAYVSHESRHTQERQVPCNDCGKLFYTLNQLDTHKRKMHNVLGGNLKYACDLCAKRYRSASMLSTHKFKKHYMTAKFNCEQCGKKFVEQEQLNSHKNIHVIKDDVT